MAKAGPTDIAKAFAVLPATDSTRAPNARELAARGSQKRADATGFLEAGDPGNARKTMLESFDYYKRAAALARNAYIETRESSDLREFTTYKAEAIAATEEVNRIESKLGNPPEPQIWEKLARDRIETADAYKKIPDIERAVIELEAAATDIKEAIEIMIKRNDELYSAQKAETHISCEQRYKKLKEMSGLDRSVDGAIEEITKLEENIAQIDDAALRRNRRASLELCKNHTELGKLLKLKSMIHEMAGELEAQIEGREQTHFKEAIVAASGGAQEYEIAANKKMWAGETHKAATVYADAAGLAQNAAKISEKIGESKTAKANYLRAYVRFMKAAELELTLDPSRLTLDIGFENAVTSAAEIRVRKIEDRETPEREELTLMEKMIRAQMLVKIASHEHLEEDHALELIQDAEKEIENQAPTHEYLQIELRKTWIVLLEQKAQRLHEAGRTLESRKAYVQIALMKEEIGEINGAQEPRYVELAMARAYRRRAAMWQHAAPAERERRSDPNALRKAQGVAKYANGQVDKEREHLYRAVEATFDPDKDREEGEKIEILEQIVLTSKTMAAVLMLVELDMAQERAEAQKAELAIKKLRKNK